MARDLRVGDDADGRLDVWLAAQLNVARTEAQRLIASGAVRVSNGPAAKSMLVQPGMLVEVEEAAEDRPVDADAPFDVRYEDDHVAVINKPAGVVVHPGHGHVTGTLVEALAKHMPLAPGPEPQRPGIVHRLDKQTSGLLVVAKTPEAFSSLIDAMKARQVSRVYLALVSGAPNMPTGRVDAPIARSSRDRIKMAVSPAGKEASTDFRVLERFEECSLMEVSLGTGRTHQIRVHLSHIGYPVVGDRVYGKPTVTLGSRLGLERPFLHASSLSFPHPIGREVVTVEEPLPEDLREVLEKLRRGEP